MTLCRRVMSLLLHTLQANSRHAIASRCSERRPDVPPATTVADPVDRLVVIHHAPQMDVNASVELVSTSGAQQQAQITGTCTWDGPHRDCTLVLTAPGISVRATAEDLFDAFCRVRE